jgi:hypothetical protein
MTTIIENLLALRAQMDATIAAVQADGSGSKLMPSIAKGAKAKAPKAEKVPRANAGMPTLHGAWTTHVLKEHSTESPEFKAFLAARIISAQAGELLYNDGHAKVKHGKKAVGDAMDEKEAAVGAHTVWVSHWRKEHAEEFEAFKSTWEAANPKESRVASAKASQASGSDAEEGEAAKVPKKRGAKKMADMTPEEQAAAKAKRAANKAAKAAAKASSEEEEAEEFGMETVVSAKAPSAAIGGGGSAAAPEAEEEMLEAEEAEETEQPEDALITFTNKKIKYLRYGHLDEDGEGVWWEGGDIWLQNADGSKGAYAGQIQASGKINASPEVMAAEPDIN